MDDIAVERVKKCRKCGEWKPFSKFFNNRKPQLKIKLNANCKSCMAEYQKEYRKNNHEKAKELRKQYYKNNPERAKEGVRKYYKNNPEKRMLWAAKHRTKGTNIPFDIQASDIVIPATCPVLGISLFSSSGSRGPNSPSLDKIIPSLGYVQGNIAVMSQRANVLKSDATLEELVLLGKWAARQIRSEENSCFAQSNRPENGQLN